MQESEGAGDQKMQKSGEKQSNKKLYHRGSHRKKKSFKEETCRRMKVGARSKKKLDARLLHCVT